MSNTPAPPFNSKLAGSDVRDHLAAPVAFRVRPTICI